MKIVIIEDEYPATERLKNLIEKIEYSFKVICTFDSIKSSVKWLNSNDSYDLIFMDIQLADGLSLEIFNQVEITKPIIFTTAYDEYALEAFEVNSIDYLLKPVSEERLRKSFNKIKLLKQDKNNARMNELISYLSSKDKKFKTRFLVRVGSVMHPILVEKIALFYINNQITKIKTFKGNTYTLDYTLDEVESSINSSNFFRINRQMIVSANAIQKIESYFSNRLILTLNPEHTDVIVSKRKVSAFKNWLE